MSSKSANADIIVWVCAAIGTVGLGAAGILSSVGYPKLAVWVGYTSALAYVVAAWMFVTRKRPGWKLRSTSIAFIVALILLAICAWLHRSVTGLRPNVLPTTNIHVESSGDQSPNIVGNEGSVTINNQHPVEPSHKQHKRGNNNK